MLFAFCRETEPTMVSEKENMLAGELYDPSDPELAEERRRAREYTRRFNRTDETGPKVRRSLLDELFGSTGEDPHVERPSSKNWTTEHAFPSRRLEQVYFTVRRVLPHDARLFVSPRPVAPR